jgi:prepilin-type N-terminal cleavage/methylation domain-containing protein
MRIKHIQAGVTLIELMIVIVITAILLALAVPAFMDTLDRNRLRAVTDTVYGDFQYAKSESIKRNQPLKVDFNISDGGVTWCYGFVLGAGASCDCEVEDPEATDACVIDPGVLKVVRHTDYKGVSMAASADFAFDNVRGTVNPGNPAFDSITLDSERGKQTRVDVYDMGKIRTCSPSGSANVAGYSTPCP